MKKTIFSILILVVALQTHAQVFIGSGFAVADSYGTSGLDFAAGFTFQVEKGYNLPGSERLKMHPNINISFLHSNADRVVSPVHLNALSFSPKVSYEIISKERFKLAPFANPFASYLLGLQGNDLLFESETIDRFTWGIEGGIRVDVVVGETTVRLIPLSVQRSIGDFYQQVMISLLVSI